MTQEERSLYTKPSKNPLGNLLGQEAVKQLTEEVRKSNLRALVKDVEDLEQVVNKIAEAIRSRRKELASLRKDLRVAEQNLSISKQNLSIAKRNSELAKRRITKRSP